MQRFSLKQLAEKWPSPIVARTEVSKFSGGVLSEKTLANLDSIGQGPPREKWGRRVFYPVEDLILWMENKANNGEPGGGL